jgi:hypothetical protein
MKSWMSLCKVSGGFIRFWLFSVNSMYGCLVKMCLSGGFCSKVIFSSKRVVQSGFGVCVRSWLHVSLSGLIVTISAYRILGGG